MSERTQEPLHLSRAVLESAVLRLGSKDDAVRAEAERVIKQSGVGAIEPLIAVLTRELRKHQKRRWVVLAAALALTLGCYLVMFHLRENDYLGLTIGFAICMVGIFVSAYMALPTRLQKQTAAMLMGIDDLRAIGPLIDVLRNRHTAESTQVRSLLLPMLQRLRASDVALIEDRHREYFHYVLKHWEHFQLGPQYGTEYIVAVLTALQQVGNGGDLPYVERIAYPDRTLHAALGFHWLWKGYNSAFKLLLIGQWRGIDKPRIVQAAQECLPYLQLKDERQQVSNSLLRASDPGNSTSDSLLRPAGSAATSEPDQLLRSSPSTETEPVL
jgi:hypothetical protein